ncbi:enoyl-CoA hydratase [Clostridium acetobutylicum]|uniref:Short-chain-enoyl-CoA hydratase n=2 Tax=Clostridium acetobutylicum (strain ATCC 824 / DSM 792 / JCM 1419 / IAM 19013 / LMG 5710 / NBRC 13948 / NRRL B-527 / VKM B-1787 / 2291 / W) TaxID=272562 RepID=CRT_CLOAB|nr:MULTISPECIES: short-chain-enoyl-CoA hydratase [Clostridium]P52046.1 RecName: Full=Short-chain-enoyl-CoA hydratase; AltName: Full=3-hydroxybutyryl-CoA dehydratase; AltName: Full=Crotonase [Clostridium acetobutylicum ATCC 824]QJR97830.1 3-hydroxybutyryl-CoA dehydratase [Cloning vector pCloDF13-URRrthc]AAA95967.1 crotonase [Clostridium acetobutylicum ATCC 824]AAK80658.1 Crotonase (3-hydroxybutyryl-COA dehydratase) [Clostridium acetobutylicum ATCC 824]ADZ21757.1 3-hydroxybutyryl-CoA dehydratase
MELNNVILEKEGKVAVVTINRPKALNALNSDTLKEMDYVIGEIENDSEVLAVILTGAGEKSFVAGADISEMKEMNTIEGRKFGILGNKVFRRLELLEKPVIAAVNGFALGGGCEIAMSCDIRIASSNARFGQPEVGLGITPGFGGTQRLSRLVGMGMAKQLIFTAQNIKADEALRIGLVNKVVEPSELMNTAKEIANKIVSNAPVAVKLSKQAINRGMQCDIDTALAFESEAFGECFSTEDQKDAMTAFIEKRKIEGFKNR